MEESIAPPIPTVNRKFDKYSLLVLCAARYSRRMNWPHIVDELRSRGWTQVLLAARLGIAQSAVSELRTGGTKDPKHSTGHAIAVLYESGELPAIAAPELAEPPQG